MFDLVATPKEVAEDVVAVAPVSAEETEFALPAGHAAEPAEPEALQAGDGELMPPRHHRASFAERVRNRLGGAG